MKKNIILKRILIGILIFLAVAAVSGFCVYEFYVKPKITEPIINSIDNGLSKDDLEVDKLFDELKDVLHDEEMQAYLNEESPNKATELLFVVEKAQEDRAERIAEKKAQEPVNADNTQQDQTAPEKNNTSDSKSRIDKIKSQVSPSDLKDGLALAGRADIGYILGLLSGGLTSEERAELKQYLRARYSSSEISRGIQLFAKYSYLL